MRKKKKSQYLEIIRLSNLLEENHIPYTMIPFEDGIKICIPNTVEMRYSIVECSSSLGHEKNRLEAYGLWEDYELMGSVVKGNLSAEEVSYWVKHAESRSHEKLPSVPKRKTHREFATKDPIEKYFEKIYAEIDKRYENLI